MAPRVRVYLATPEDEEALQNLARAEEFIRAFFQYLGFDDPAALRRRLNSSGRNFDQTSWSNEVRFTKPVTMREYCRDPNAKIFERTKKEMRRLKHEQEERAAEIRQRRKEVSDLSVDELEARLLDVFKVYGSLSALIEGHGEKMDTIGFQQLLRDSRVLNNGFDILEADKVFISLIEENQHQNEDSPSLYMTLLAAILMDLQKKKVKTPDTYMSFEQFKRALEQVIEAKWPLNIGKFGMKNAVGRLLRLWIIPFANMERSRLPRPVDGLYTRKTLEILHSLSGGLKATFGFFSNILLLDPKESSWQFTVNNSSTLDTNEFFLLMLSFRVSPQLLGKAEVLSVFREVEAETDVDENVDEMLFPAFLEVIARMALMLGKTFLHKMEQASPTEIPFLKHFLSVCCTELQNEYAPHLFDRGRIFEKDENGRPLLPEPLKPDFFTNNMQTAHSKWDQMRTRMEDAQSCFEVVRRRHLRSSIRARNEASVELCSRFGLFETRDEAVRVPPRRLHTSGDQFRSVTKMSLYQTAHHDLVRHNSSGESSPASASRSVSPIRLRRYPSSPQLEKGLGVDERLISYPDLASQRVPRAHSTGHHGLPPVSNTAREAAASNILSMMMSTSLISDAQQQQISGAARKRDRTAFVSTPPQRFNHENQHNPRLLDPAIGVSSVKSFHPASAISRTSSAAMPENSAGDISFPRSLSGVSAVSHSPAQHSLYMGSGAWGLM